MYLKYAYLEYILISYRGWGNSIMVSVSVCAADHPSSSPARSVCFSQKGGDLPDVINLFPPQLGTGSPKTAHVLSCICDNACKRSLAICRKSRASCPFSRLLSVPIWPACAKQGRKYDSIKALYSILRNYRDGQLLEHAETKR